MEDETTVVIQSPETPETLVAATLDAACTCDCPECQAGNCADCTNENCDCTDCKACTMAAKKTTAAAELAATVVREQEAAVIVPVNLEAIAPRIHIEHFSGAVSVMPDSLNIQDRTVDVCWYSGIAVPRIDYITGQPYDLILNMAGCRLERLNNGAPIYDSHVVDEVRDQPGVVVKAWADGARGMATIRFDTDASGTALMGKVQRRIVQTLSFGTWIHASKDITPEGAARPLEMATDWEPFEISPIAVAADFNTQFLSAETGLTMDQTVLLAAVKAKTTMQACADACGACSDSCEAGIQYCLTTGGDHAKADHMKLMMDCVACCEVCEDACETGSASVAEFCVACAAVCRKCEESCGTFAGDKTMQACAKACGSCADACDAMSKPSAGKAKMAAIQPQEIQHRASALLGVSVEQTTEQIAAELARQNAVTLAAVQEGMRVERVRAAGIRQIVALAALGEPVASQLIDGGVTLEAARVTVFEQMAARTAANPQNTTGAVTRDGRDTFKTQVEAGIMLRAEPSKATAAERELGRGFAGLSLVEVARECLNAQGVNTRGLFPDQVAKAALFGPREAPEFFEGAGMMTTSDFPGILANVANKNLRQAYDAAPKTFMPFCRQVSAKDFKPRASIQLSDVPTLSKINEKGEFHRGSVTDNKETYSLSTYGEIIPITRKVIINDDLNALTRLPAGLGVAAANLESDTVWGVITANGNMADGVALFHATHKNLNATNPLAVAGLATARAKMRVVTGPKGTYLNLTPKYLLAPAALENTALQLIYPTQLAAATPGSVIPVWMTNLIPVIEPRLDAVATVGVTNWFMVADPSQIDTIEYCYLEGQQGVYIETRYGFEVDGVEIKARLDFAAAAVEPRGLQKNTA